VLIQLIYMSQVSPDFREHEIPELLKTIRPANARLQITGMLFFLGTAFFRCLRGKRIASIVHTPVYWSTNGTLNDAISRDPIEERSFPNWTMDFATIDPVEAGEIIGDPGSFTDGARVRLDSRSANRLIAAYRRPKWKQSGGLLSAPRCVVTVVQTRAESFDSAYTLARRCA